MYKIGLGKDSHQFLTQVEQKTSQYKNKLLIIGGVKINNALGFKAHSDGDVLYHSLFNAICSALGKKSIGFYFPDTSLKEKNKNSEDYLKQAKLFLAKEKYKIENIRYY